MSQEWNHPALEQLDSIIADAQAGVAAEKIAERLIELRPLIVQLAELDPRD